MALVVPLFWLCYGVFCEKNVSEKDVFTFNDRFVLNTVITFLVHSEHKTELYNSSRSVDILSF